ncbi:hypothetical protein EV127DRAFT_447471 [Xylaria flabelliformis]|nr:hypothetical protein EV127DRAFT_447471 [Xylaria flabelliformis]
MSAPSEFNDIMDILSETRRVMEMEAERRRRPLAERRAEDRERNLAEFKHSSELCIFQPTPARGAKAECSYDDCLHESTQGRRIKQDYRITTTDTDSKPYYHVDCFEAMVDVQELLACNKLCADKSPYRWNNGRPWQWSLMFRKWFEHKGCISLDAIAAYIDEWERYEEELPEFSRKCFQAQREKNPGGEEIKGPKKPILRGYTTRKEDSCTLSAVMKHECSEKLREIFAFRGIQFEGMENPEWE